MVKRKPSETQNEVQRKKGRKNAEESSDDDVSKLKNKLNFRKK